MKIICLALLLFIQCATLVAQTTNAPLNQQPDDRFKADILLIVAHPDDETAVFTYLAKAVLDEGKRVAIVYTTHGAGGGNVIGRERAAALGMIRETEVRRALAAFGIYNVWILDGRGATNQNALLSLANLNHAKILEETIRAVRLTRPEIVLTWLPALAGDHGDHQSAGIIATEAFDQAGDPSIFPIQVTARRSDFESSFEGLRAWQAKKIYYFTDSLWLDLKGKTPEYSSKETSPSRKVSYETLAAQEASFHLTQEDNKPFADAIAKGELDKYLREAKSTLGFDIFPNPVRLFLGKSHVKTNTTSDVFDGITRDAISFQSARGFQTAKRTGVSLTLGSAWNFYSDFWRAHNLDELAAMLEPRIYITAGNTLQVPLLLRNDSNEPQEIELKLKTKLSDGWSENAHPSRFTVEARDVYPIQISITTPKQPSEDWREITYAAEVKGREVSSVVLKAQLRGGTIPQ